MLFDLNKYVVYLSVVLLMALPCTSYALYTSVANIALIVVDEDGTPIKDALASVTFNAEGHNKLEAIRGYTNTSGEYAAQGKAFLGKVYYTIKKEGWYDSRGEYTAKDVMYKSEPWEKALKISLRKIINPVPMYAQKKLFTIPAENKPIGFDFIIGDFVRPYGNGIVTDATFCAVKNIVSDNDMEANLEIKFSNRYDGIIIIKEDTRAGSVFDLPRHAPEAGYSSIHNVTVKRVPGEWYKESFADDDNFILRIRSESNNGIFSRAIHGKIKGPIKFYPVRAKSAQIEMTYYINPDFTRNLEFDPKRNLYNDSLATTLANEP